jgi:hypothetical protein
VKLAIGRGRRRALAALGAALACSAAAAAAAQADVAPRILAPSRGAMLALGSEPVFKAVDHGDAADHKMWVVIAPAKKRDRVGRLLISNAGDFTEMKRGRHGVFTYQPPDYDFPGWFMVTPHTYWMQVYHLNCGAPRASRTGCRVYSKLRSFRVG